MCVRTHACRSFHKGNIFFCNLFSPRDPCQFYILLSNTFVPTLKPKYRFKRPACAVGLRALTPRAHSRTAPGRAALEQSSCGCPGPPPAAANVTQGD